MNVSPDNENSSVNILHFGQAGLGLPDRDYYFKSDSVSVTIQNAYKNYLTTLFKLTDTKNADENAAIAYGIEKKLAASHKTRIERRNVKANYNKMAVSDINKSQPNIGWSKLLNQLNLKADAVDIKQPAYYKELNTLLASVSISDWKTYLKAATLSTYADILSKPFENANFVRENLQLIYPS